MIDATAELRRLISLAKLEMAIAMLAPLDDPDAPAGYVTAAYAELESRRRIIAVREIAERLVEAVTYRCGPVYGDEVREHVEAIILAELGGTELH